MPTTTSSISCTPGKRCGISGSLRTLSLCDGVISRRRATTRVRWCVQSSARGGVSMPVDPVVAGYLAAVADDLDAAKRLAAPPANRLAAYHLQQAAEKLVKAVLVHRKIHPGIEHRIDVLVRMLDPLDPWQPL